MDRGMTSGENLEFLRSENRRYIIGTSKSQLRNYEQALLSREWQTIRDGLKIKLCPSEAGNETFVVCRSADRA